MFFFIISYKLLWETIYLVTIYSDYILTLFCQVMQCHVSSAPYTAVMVAETQGSTLGHLWVTVESGAGQWRVIIAVPTTHPFNELENST